MRQVFPPLAEATNVLEAARQMGWVVGTPETIVEQLLSLEAAGVDLAILGHYDLTDDQSLELIANDVMPAVA
jgi:alkanesulfonate monooxygenase SsuD/methylene tetrahydromethanopterin reductase-like flavin-dependent oxidoreductase (luciferase family)